MSPSVGIASKSSCILWFSAAIEIARRQSQPAAGLHRWGKWDRHTFEPSAKAAEQATLPVTQLPLLAVQLETSDHPLRQHGDAGTNHHRLQQTQRPRERRRARHDIEELEH